MAAFSRPARQAVCISVLCSGKVFGFALVLSDTAELSLYCNCSTSLIAIAPSNTPTCAFFSNNRLSNGIFSSLYARCRKLPIAHGGNSRCPGSTLTQSLLPLGTHLSLQDFGFEDLFASEDLFRDTDRSRHMRSALVLDLDLVFQALVYKLPR